MGSDGSAAFVMVVNRMIVRSLTGLLLLDQLDDNTNPDQACDHDPSQDDELNEFFHHALRLSN